MYLKGLLEEILGNVRVVLNVDNNSAISKMELLTSVASTLMCGSILYTKSMRRSSLRYNTVQQSYKLLIS